MLLNAYFLAKFRFDTAENEPAKNLQNFANFPNFANPNPDITDVHRTFQLSRRPAPGPAWIAERTGALRFGCPESRARAAH